jgi:hypothetical protein
MAVQVIHNPCSTAPVSPVEVPVVVVGTCAPGSSPQELTESTTSITWSAWERHSASQSSADRSPSSSRPSKSTSPEGNSYTCSLGGGDLQQADRATNPGTRLETISIGRITLPPRPDLPQGPCLRTFRRSAVSASRTAGGAALLV